MNALRAHACASLVLCTRVLLMRAHACTSMLPLHASCVQTYRQTHTRPVCACSCTRTCACTSPFWRCTLARASLVHCTRVLLVHVHACTRVRTHAGAVGCFCTRCSVQLQAWVCSPGVQSLARLRSPGCAKPCTLVHVLCTTALTCMCPPCTRSSAQVVLSFAFAHASRARAGACSRCTLVSAKLHAHLCTPPFLAQFPSAFARFMHTLAFAHPQC